MSNKRKLATILAVAGATVLAAGGSAFVTNAGLSVVDPDASKSQGSEVAINEKETELPMTVEKFAATKDSFTVKPQSDSDKKNGKNSDKNEESEQETDSTDGSTRSDSTTGDGSSTGSGASTDFSSSQYYSADGKFYNESEGGYYDDNGLYHDQWGGYYSADGAYYDGQGGYWDGDGYHSTGSGSSSTGSSSSGSNSTGSSSSGGSSSGITIDDGSGSTSGGSSSGSNSGAYDDSYMMYDVDSRYISADELSSWSSEDLAKLRNEIFARHGRIFKTQKWIDYFATKTWYVPRYDNVDSMLNDYEWANLDVILKLEDQRS